MTIHTINCTLSPHRQRLYTHLEVGGLCLVDDELGDGVELTVAWKRVPDKETKNSHPIPCSMMNSPYVYQTESG